jgi:hypothetical protein
MWYIFFEKIRHPVKWFSAEAMVSKRSMVGLVNPITWKKAVLKKMWRNFQKLGPLASLWLGLAIFSGKTCTINLSFQQLECDLVYVDCQLLYKVHFLYLRIAEVFNSCSMFLS